MVTKIPVCVPKVPKHAKEYINLLIDQNWIGSGCKSPDLNFINKLECDFSRYVGAKFGIATTSGTTALQLALASLGIGADDEVIIPCFTMIATATAVVHVNAKPVPIDVCPHTWCLDIDQLEAAITEKTRAIIPVHVYGYPVDMDPLIEIADKYRLWVIEDAAEAIGTVYKGRHAGGIGHVGCFSFYSNKTVQSGEGGMLVTSDEAIAAKARSLKDHAFTKNRFIHEAAGYNFKMSNLTAAFAYASFEELSDNVSRKIAVADRYNRNLAKIDGVYLPPASTSDFKNSYWMYGIRIDPNRFGCNKFTLKQRLLDCYGIETRDFFYPISHQPALKSFFDNQLIERFPVSRMLYNQGIYLPSTIDLSKEEIDYITAAIKQIKSTSH